MPVPLFKLSTPRALPSYYSNDCTFVWTSLALPVLPDMSAQDVPVSPQRIGIQSLFHLPLIRQSIILSEFSWNHALFCQQQFKW